MLLLTELFSSFLVGVRLRWKNPPRHASASFVADGLRGTAERMMLFIRSAITLSCKP